MKSNFMSLGKGAVAVNFVPENQGDEIDCKTFLDPIRNKDPKTLYRVMSGEGDSIIIEPIQLG